MRTATKSNLFSIEFPAIPSCRERVVVASVHTTAGIVRVALCTVLTSISKYYSIACKLFVANGIFALYHALLWSRLVVSHCIASKFDAHSNCVLRA
jgi:hypothetical protein